MKSHLNPAILIAFAFLFQGCENKPEILPLEFQDVQLSKLSSCRELDQLREVPEYEREILVFNETGDFAPAADGASGGESETNVQVQGVDELDLAKAVGNFLYTVDHENHEIIVIQRTPLDKAGIVQRLSYSSELHVIGLYLNEDRGAILANRSYSPQEPALAIDGNVVSDGYYYGGNQGTKVVYLKRKLNGELELDGGQLIRGSFRGSRLIDDRLLLVQELYVPRRYRNQIQDQEKIEVEYFLPSAQKDDEETRLNECSDIYAENSLRDRNRVRPVVSALQCIVDLSLVKRKNQPSTNCVAGQSTSVIYVSLDNFYLATSDWASDQTPIHRFELKSDRVEYRGSQVVDGTLLNQFSMDEYEGHLRVAYSESLWNWGGGMIVDAVAPEAIAQTGTAEPVEPTEPSSAVETFKLIPQGLLPKGRVDGLGPNESIHAVRFLGNRGYVVTFRRVDPLYVLDLDDPENLSILGELKISGFSEYLHPISDGVLFSVGQEATDTGMSQGLAFSIFDVRDPENPKMVERIHDESSHQSSEVEYDHHAFLYVESKSMVSVPVSDYTKNEMYFLLLDVSESGMEERAKVPSTSSLYYGPSRSFFSDGIFVFLTPEEAIWRLDSNISSDAKRINLR